MLLDNNDADLMLTPRHHELDTIALKVAEFGDSCLKGSNGVMRPIQCSLIRDLIPQRNEAQYMKTRKNISKQIHKESIKELRPWMPKCAEPLLEKFEKTVL